MLFFLLGKKYTDEKMSDLARKAVKEEDLDDGTFVAYLMLQNKLTPKQIYTMMAEIMTGSVDTVSTNNMLCSTGI